MAGFVPIWTDGAHVGAAYSRPGGSLKQPLRCTIAGWSWNECCRGPRTSHPAGLLLTNIVSCQILKVTYRRLSLLEGNGVASTVLYVFLGIYWAFWGRAGAIRELRAGSFLIGKWKARGGAQRAGRARQLGKRTGQVIGLTYTYLCSRDVI